MLTAPIIHTRTFNNDFLSGFLVRPDYFTSEDIDWARRLIRASTADIDLMKGERYVVLDNGKIRVAGIVTLTSELANMTNRAIENRFFFDKQGRNIYAFIGICTKSPLQSSLILTYNDFADIFEKYVIPVFDDKVVETQLVHDCVSVEKNGLIDKPKDNGITLNQCTIYESTYESDKKWFNYYLCCKKQSFSFCSNVSKYQTIKESIFDFITTTPNNIKRLKINMPDINRAAQQQEETNYQQFKEKYHDRLISEFEQEFRKMLLQDDKFIEEIQNMPQTIDMVVHKLFCGSIKDTYNYEIVSLRKVLNSYYGDGKGKKEQQPISIIKKEHNDVK